jgi:pre-60S factor REI1
MIPDDEWLTDLEGLMNYCMTKVLGGAECLYCNRKFRSIQACQQHMRDLGHCKLPIDVDGGDRMEEYGEFYDLDAKFESNPWFKEGVEVLPTGGALPRDCSLGAD